MIDPHTYSAPTMKILVVQLGDIGDVVLSFPAIRALRHFFPNVEIVVAVRKKAADLVSIHPDITAVIPVEKQKTSFMEAFRRQTDFFSKLRQFRFDMAIDLRTGTRGAILCFLSGAKMRIGFKADDEPFWRNSVFNHLIKLKYTPGQYVADYYSSLLQRFGIPIHDRNPELKLDTDRLFNAKNFLDQKRIPDNRPIVAIQPFSLWGYKEWGVEKYARLIKRIVSVYDAGVLITGGPSESKKADTLLRLIDEPVYSLVGETSLAEYAGILKCCDLFIGGDSAGIHIAAAVGTPTVSIFGPSAPSSWAPRGKKHRVVFKNYPCVPCRRKGCQDTEKSRCLEELTVDEVFAPVVEQLDNTPRGD